MNEIIRNQEYDDLISSMQELETELAILVYDRDQLLYHICPKLKAEYMLKIGKLEYAIFEYQCKILRTRRKIEIIQSFINREQLYIVAKIEKQLDCEYQEYTKKLLEKKQEIENARLKKSSLGKPLTAKETVELKKLYTQIVKKLHPDINPDTTEEQHSQFSDAVNAYKRADLPELRIIYLLIEKTSTAKTSNSMDNLKSRKELLIDQKSYLLNEIEKIHAAFPYNVKDMLNNKEILQKKIDELSGILAEHHEQCNNIEKRLESMILSGHE